MTTTEVSIKSRRGFWLKLVVSLGACVLLIWLVDWNEFSTILVRGDPLWLLVVFGLIHLDRIFMASKWAMLLRALGMQVSTGTAIKAYYVGSFWSSFLPVSVGGDVIRVSWLAKEGHAASEVIPSVVVERLLGALALALVALFSLALFVIYPGSDQPVFWQIILTLLVGSVVAIAVLFSRSTHQLIQRMTSRLPLGRVGRIIEKMRMAVLAFREQPGVLLLFVALSVVEASLPIVAIYLLAQAFAIGVPLIWVIIAVPLILVVAALPISVRGIGLIEGTYAFVFSLAGLPVSAAVMLSVMDRVLVLLATLPGALWTVSASGRSTALPVVPRPADAVEGE